MRKAKYSLFERFIAIIWCFSVTFLWMATFAGHLMSLREIDGKIGLLANPLYSTIENSTKNLEKLFQPVEARAFPVEDVVVQQQLIALNGQISARNTQIDLEKILQIAVRRAIANFVSSIVQLVLGLFNKLIDAIESAINAATGLRLNLGSFRAVLAIKARKMTENINQDINTWLDKVWPIKNKDLQNKAGNLVNAYQTAKGVNFSQAGLPQGVALPGTASQASLDATRSALAVAIGASVCAGVDQVNPSLQVLQGASLGDGCRREAAANAVVELDTVSNQGATNLQTLQQNTEGNAPADCKGIGTIDTKQLENLNYKFDNSINFDISKPAPTANSTTTNVFQNGATITNFNDKIDVLANNTGVGTFSKEQCDLQSRVNATIASANTGNKPAPGIDDASILDTLFAAFIDLLSQLFTKLIDAVLKVFVQAVNKLLGVTPGFLQNFVAEVAGGVSRYIAGGLDNLRRDVIKDAACATISNATIRQNC